MLNKNMKYELNKSAGNVTLKVIAWEELNSATSQDGDNKMDLDIVYITISPTSS